MWRALLACTVLCYAALPLKAAPEKMFFFGNSLIHHLSETPDTALPTWLDRLAKAGGHPLAMDGTWGFPHDFLRNLPPTPEWHFPDVTRVMTDDPRSFRMAGFDTVVLAPPNFVQYAAPDRRSHEGAMTDLIGRSFDWLRNQIKAQLYIYEGWETLGENAFPPTDAIWQDWLARAEGEYHDWYRHLVAQLSTAESTVSLIPVSSTMAHLVTDGPLQGLTPTDLYTDAGPHGTETTYLLAAMITYAALYHAPPPVIPLPETIHPLLRDGYARVATAIWQEVSGMQAPQGASLQAPDTGWAAPSLALGLAEIADYATQTPFIDLMKTSRPWIGHLPEQWGALSNDDLRNGGYLDPQGWPLALPAGVTALETMILTDMPIAATPLAGRYHVTWQGKGDLAIRGNVADVVMATGTAAFTYTPGPGLVILTLTAIDPADPIRDIRVIREDHLPLAEAGLIFNPDWLAVVRDARSLRFLDWMATNGSPIVTWGDRPRVDDASYTRRGVPLEVMVELANLVGADPWFTLPHQADDDYIRRFAMQVYQTLDPALIAHAEWSNEVWNFIFPQATWAQDQAALRWGADVPQDAWMQFAGHRAAEMADIWADVFADAPDRLTRVIGVHTGWRGLETPLLDAPLRQAEGLPAPVDSFDAYAVSGYFGYEIGAEENATRLLRWVASPDPAPEITRTIREGSLRQLTTELWPYHADIAARHGLDLVMYEGGTHILAYGPASAREDVTRLLTRYNYSADMAGLYSDAIRAWRQLGDGPFMGFVDVAPPSRWGSWGALRHLGDMNPRWATLQGWNSLPHGSLAGERPLPDRGAALTHGVIHLAAPDNAPTRITGTPRSDVLVGSPADEIFYPQTGDDMILGGGGQDHVVLTGKPQDWSAYRAGDSLWMVGQAGKQRLTGIATLSFSAAPTEVFAADAPAGASAP